MQYFKERAEDLIRTLIHRRRVSSRRAGAVDFNFRGYRIPYALADMTGGGAETWEAIALSHIAIYDRLCPIAPDHKIVEIGCGVGRDAMVLGDRLGPEGKYVGIDIIRESIDWCKQSIAAADARFRFEHFDVCSPLHNPSGVRGTRDVRIPVEDAFADRVLAQSVLTHMFRDDIVHYLREIQRVLRPDGLACLSMFVVDEALRGRLAAVPGRRRLTFQTAQGTGCWIDVAWKPEAAVAYSFSAIEAMVGEAGLRFARPIARGNWSGENASDHGQDIVTLGRMGSAVGT